MTVTILVTLTHKLSDYCQIIRLTYDAAYYIGMGIEHDTACLISSLDS